MQHEARELDVTSPYRLLTKRDLSMTLHWCTLEDFAIPLFFSSKHDHRMGEFSCSPSRARVDQGFFAVALSTTPTAN